MRIFERFAPIFVSVLCLIGIVGYAWYGDTERAKLEGQIEEHIRREQTFETQIEIYKAHVVALRVEMAKSGIRTPEPNLDTIKLDKSERQPERQPKRQLERQRKEK